MRAPSETHIRAALLVALAMAATTAGCRTTPEAAPESSTGAAVQPAITTPVVAGPGGTDATTEYATGSAPEAWPADLPFYPSASILSSRITRADDLLDMRVSLSTRDGLDAVIAWHEGMAERNGWVVESAGTLIQDNVEWNYLYLKKAGSSANVSIARESAGTLAITVATRSW